MYQKPTLEEMAKQIHQYREELKKATPGSFGLKKLLPMVDRHYYITLLTTVGDSKCSSWHNVHEIHSESDCSTSVNRWFWMHFPSSHLNDKTPWPCTTGLVNSINLIRERAGATLLPVGSSLKEINEALRTDFLLQVPIEYSQATHKALETLNDMREERYDAIRLSTEALEYHKKLIDYFGRNIKDDKYSSLLRGFEKQNIFGDVDNEKVWIFFPIYNRHLFVGVLVARVPNIDLRTACELLPLYAPIIGEKILSIFAKNNWGHPVTNVNSELDVISLMSTIAAQCGLRKLTQDRFYIFTDDDGNKVANPKFDKLETSEFHIRTDDKIDYFNALMNECNAELIRFRNSMAHQTKVARAAIMSRNFSHNVGSHALANPKLHDSLKMTAIGKDPSRKRLSTFHSYAQGRLDFMARAMSGSDERPEPLFLVNDMLNGFFRQGALLDTLVEDMGFPARRLQFIVTLPESEDVAFNWTEDSDNHRFTPQENAIIKDVLVGVPGGAIGCHALYGFLENCLRNSVKYGERTKELSEAHKLIITLKIEKCSGFISTDSTISDAWVLRISDNVSVDKDNKVTVLIRRHINQNIIRDENDTSSEGHGIQEMKVCAEILAGGAAGPMFMPDNAYKELQCSPQCTSCKEYSDYLPKQTAPLNKPHSFRCYSAPNDENSFLTYNLLLSIPVLLGVLDYTEEIKHGYPESIKQVKSIDELAMSGAHFGIILDNDTVDVQAVLIEISIKHPALPFRLMIITSVDTRMQLWKKAIQKLEGRDVGQPFRRGRIPHNRIKIICNEDLATCIVHGTQYEYLKATEWQAVILRVYDSWIKAYKHLPDGVERWNLRIGFEREPDQVLPAWEAAIAAFDNTSCVSILVAAMAKGGSTDSKRKVPSANFDEKSANILNSCLVFDNHGKVSDEDEISSYRFYQKVGSSDGLSLYQSLEVPPCSAFAFAFFVYTLTESALTQIVVIDERVSQSTIDTTSPSNPRLFNNGIELNFQDAGIFPLMQVHRAEQSIFISSSLDQVAEKQECKRNIKDEGLTIGNDGSISIASGVNIDENIAVKKLNCDDPSSFYRPDVVVMHEGIADILHSQQMWAEEDAWRIYDAVPNIVRTSGRGRNSRYLGNWLPFMEFTELSENTYRGLNKVALVKSLLGSNGDLNSLSEGMCNE